MESRLTGDCALHSDRAGHRSLGEILGELGVPRLGCVGNRALCGHPLLDRAPPVITLVRLHWSPLR